MFTSIISNNYTSSYFALCTSRDISTVIIIYLKISIVTKFRNSHHLPPPVTTTQASIKQTDCEIQTGWWRPRLRDEKLVPRNSYELTLIARNSYELQAPLIILSAGLRACARNFKILSYMLRAMALSGS